MLLGIFYSRENRRKEDGAFPMGANDVVLSNVPSTLNSVALVRERTIPTERPPPVGEVSANFCG